MEEKSQCSMHDLSCIKLVWGVERVNKRYFQDNLLAGGIPSMMSSALVCYGNFFHGLKNSDALELRTPACAAASDIRSRTGTNLSNLGPSSLCALHGTKCPLLTVFSSFSLSLCPGYLGYHRIMTLCMGS